jgi:addiction module HigA family antidote
MIVRFMHKRLERLFRTGGVSGVPPQRARRFQLILALLNAARHPVMMDAPGLRFHALRGDREDQHRSRCRETGASYSGSTARMVSTSTLSTTIERQVGMKMHDPPHPGEILRELYLVPLSITVTAAAERLGVTRKALSELLNGHTSISRDMAIRLAKAFPSTDIRFWLDLQLQYDAWQAEQRAASIKVKPFSIPA